MVLSFLFPAIEASLRLRGARRRTLRLPSGAEISYLEAGRGPPEETLLLVHGLGSSAMTWLHVLIALARDRRVVAVDLPGYGHSPLANGRDHSTFHEFVQALGAFVADRTLFPAPPTLLAQSMGAWIAIRVARLHPANIRHLILVNSAGILFGGIEELRSVIDPKTKEEVAAFWDRLYHNPPRLYTTFWRDTVKKMHVPQVTKFVDALGEEDFINDDLPQLQMPVSIVWGRADRYMPLKTVDAFVHGLGSTQVLWVAQCGHVPQIERPKEFVRIVRGLLGTAPQDLPPPPASAH